jgi:S1-C subfamily serine protease
MGVTAAIVFNNSSTSSSALNVPAADSVVYIENGVSGDVIISDPFLNKTSEVNIVYDPLDSGSGFIVNDAGYIITAFHVVGDPQAVQDQGVLRLMESGDIQQYLERAAVSGYLSRYNPQLGSELINNSTTSTPVLQTQPDVNTTTDLMNQRNLIQVKSAKQQIRVRLPGSNAGEYADANLVDIGNPETSEDMALIKINTFFTRLHPLTLSSNTPTVNQKIQIYGYPVTNPGVDYKFNSSSLQPASTTGVVTSELLKNGTFYYENTAETTHGYSGGPVLDTNNNVLGILIYSLVTPNTTGNTTEQSGSVFLSSKYIIQLLKKNNVSINMV